MKKYIIISLLIFLFTNSVVKCAQQNKESEEAILFDVDENQEPIKYFKLGILWYPEQNSIISELAITKTFKDSEHFKDKKIGEVASELSDEWNFNDQNKFRRGEIVLVKRTNGTFTYGIILFKGYKEVKMENSWFIQVGIDSARWQKTIKIGKRY